MNNMFTDNNNAWVYLKWSFQDQDWNGEATVSSYPISLAEITEYLNGEADRLSQDEEIYFATTGWVFFNDSQDRHMFNESAVYEAELKRLYHDYKNTTAASGLMDTFNKPSILLSLNIPCSESKSSQMDFPMPLPSFFQIIQAQYERPEAQSIIEDFPF